MLPVKILAVLIDFPDQGMDYCDNLMYFLHGLRGDSVKTGTVCSLEICSSFKNMNKKIKENIWYDVILVSIRNYQSMPRYAHKALKESAAHKVAVTLTGLESIFGMKLSDNPFDVMFDFPHGCQNKKQRWDFSKFLTLLEQKNFSEN